jgi:TPR repeat protein
MTLVSENAPGAAELASRTVNENSEILMSSDSAADRQRALMRLNIAAKEGSNAAARRIEAFEKAYDRTKSTIAKSPWWLRGEDARPAEARRWIEDGLMLAAAGDRPAMLDQAYATGHGRGLEQDRAQSVRLYRQVIERSGGEDAFSKTLRASAVRGLSAVLNAVVSWKDHNAAIQLQSQMEATANAGAADMQYYLGLFSECVADPPDFGIARQWYRKAAMNVAWKNPAERKLALLGKWCPLNAN